MFVFRRFLFVCFSLSFLLLRANQTNAVANCNADCFFLSNAG